MKVSNPLLQISVCLATGGLVTVGIICFFIGFGIHSPVGKYALYTALFLQALCLVVNRIVDRPYIRGNTAYTPSRKMVRFALTAESLWIIGVALQLGTLLLILLGMEPTDPWVRHLTLPGILMTPPGCAGILLSSHRRRSAIRSIRSSRHMDGEQ